MTWLSLVSVLCGLSALVAAQGNSSVVASNSSAFTHTAINNTAVLVTSATEPQNLTLFPLTPVAYSSLPNGPTAAKGPGGTIVEVTANNSQNLQADDIAYVPCDAEAWQGFISLQNAIDTLTQTNVTSIVFYSTEQTYCNLVSPLSNSYQLAYTTTNAANATNLLQHLTGMFGPHGAEQAMIFSYEAFNNAVTDENSGGGLGSSAPSTAVAMIILYSITGVITALFLVIIITGAIRAHRHPERYGPRNIIGRARQSRAKGIARAMLDTIPIVKFGQEEQDTKPGDVELASSSDDQARQRASSDETGKDTTQATTEATSPHGVSSASEERSARDSEGPHAATTGAQDVSEDNSLGCSICTEDFERGEDVRMLPCKHKFHPACVDPWLLDVSGTCPLCRVDLRPPEEREEQDTQDGTETAAMPPPLDPEGGRNNRRRRALLNLFDRPRLSEQTREERIATLRRFRQQQLGRAASTVDGTEQSATDEQQENETRWRRVRRSLVGLPFRNSHRQSTVVEE